MLIYSRPFYLLLSFRFFCWAIPSGGQSWTRTSGIFRYLIYSQGRYQLRVTYPNNGGKSRNRTYATRIFSPLLYLLSYLPVLAIFKNGTDASISSCKLNSRSFELLSSRLGGPWCSVMDLNQPAIAYKAIILTFELTEHICDLFM